MIGRSARRKRLLPATTNTDTGFANRVEGMDVFKF
jgi:hypothetical protein